MKRRVYVMDCGNFVKIGVSIHPDRRKNQIPYEVKQYYCSEPIANSFEVEKEMHSYLCRRRNNGAFGREYFDISFPEAVRMLTESLNYSQIDFHEQATDNLKILLFGTEKERKIEEKMNARLVNCICHMSEFDIGYFAGKYCSL